VEPSLEELINQLKAIDGLVNDWLSDQLMSSLSSLASPDDLFNFFDKLRGSAHMYYTLAMCICLIKCSFLLNLK